MARVAVAAVRVAEEAARVQPWVAWNLELAMVATGAALVVGGEGAVSAEVCLVVTEMELVAAAALGRAAVESLAACKVELAMVATGAVEVLGTGMAVPVGAMAVCMALVMTVVPQRVKVEMRALPMEEAEAE